MGATRWMATAILAVMLAGPVAAEVEQFGNMEPGKGRLLRQRIKDGEVVKGTFVVMAINQAIPKLLKRVGLDFYILDVEHQPIDHSMTAAMINASRHAGIASWVRVVDVDKNISLMLDFGADGVVVPMVETREQAEKLVYYGRHKPEGGRNISTGSNQVDFQIVPDTKAWLAQRNREVSLIIMIESQKGIDNIDEIFSVPGIDGCVIGTGDLAYDIGHAGDLKHPAVEAAVEQIMEAGLRHGIWVATVIRRPEDVAPWARRENHNVLVLGAGYRMLAIGAELFNKAVDEALAAD